MPARFTYHGSPFAQQIQQQGFKSGAPTNSLSLGSKPITFADLFQQGPKTFTSTSPNVASMYGKNIPVVSSTRNLSLPSGGINSTGVRFGNEVVQTPGQATKGMNIANKALERSARGVSPTATRLAGGATVSGLGGSTPGNLGIKALGTLASLPAQAAMFTLGSTPANADEANMTPEDFAALNAAQNTISPTTNRNFDRDFSQLPSYGDAISRTNVQGMDLEMDPAAQQGFLNPNIQPSQNMFQRAGNAIQGGLGSIRDFAVDKGMSAKNLLGSGAAMAMGLPGIVGSGAMSLLGGLGNMFEDRQLSGGLGTIVDEYGRSYTAEELNKQNALGGYYTDPARASRRRAKSIFKLSTMKNKNAAQKRRLEKLKAQELIQEQARQEAARQMQDSNRSSGRGGYQAGYSGDFMEGDPNAGGRATTATMGSSAMGGIIGHGGTGGRPAQSGLASMFVRRG